MATTKRVQLCVPRGGADLIRSVHFVAGSFEGVYSVSFGTLFWTVDAFIISVTDSDPPRATKLIPRRELVPRHLGKHIRCEETAERTGRDTKRHPFASVHFHFITLPWESSVIHNFYRLLVVLTASFVAILPLSNITQRACRKHYVDFADWGKIAEDARLVSDCQCNHFSRSLINPCQSLGGIRPC